MKNDSFGDRMKNYESRETDRHFLPFIPVYARIDGRGFSKFTRGAIKPFDPIINDAMSAAAKMLVENTGAIIAYHQSDEISLIWETIETGEEMFFNGKVQKLCSVIASLATAAFIKSLLGSERAEWVNRLPHFDARVIQLPNRTEATNMLLWREIDARKNAISMAAHTQFSHKSLQGLSGQDKLKKLAEKGIVWDEFPVAFRRGSFMRRVTREIAMDESTRLRIPEAKRPEPGFLIERSMIEVIDMPPFNEVVNRNAVIFDGADPVVS